MFDPLENPQRSRDRRENAAITRAQLRIQGARVRENIRHWYRRLMGRGPAERQQLRATIHLTTILLTGAPPYSSDVQQPMRARAAQGKHLHSHHAALSDCDQGPCL